MKTTNSIRQALGYTSRKLITAGHAYIIDVRGPREIYHDRRNCFQVVAETMVYRNCELGPTLHLPFDPSVGVSEELLRFLEWPLRPFFDRYVWQGVPCFALRLGQDAAMAERVMRLLLVDVYDYATETDVQCRVHDEGPLQTGDRPDGHAAPDRIPDEDSCPER